jgi:hypothetical protein
MGPRLLLCTAKDYIALAGARMQYSRKRKTEQGRLRFIATPEGHKILQANNG